MQNLKLEENDILFGTDRTARIVAAERAGRFIRLFIRTDQKVVFRDDPFYPFILLETEQDLSGFEHPFSVTHLAGTGIYRFLITFGHLDAALAAKNFLQRRSRKMGEATLPHLFINDPIHQHLLLSGKTLFKGMEFHHLHRLSFDIEVFCSAGYEFPNARREADRIISVAYATSDGECEAKTAHDMSEPHLIQWLTEKIRHLDPDVIEGHNIFRFDLEYLQIRAARHGLKLLWGRNGSDLYTTPSRFTVAERIIDYPRFHCYGRHFIDTYFLLQLYDVNTRELESHSLKGAARHFDLVRPDRVYIEGEEISRAFQDNPARLKEYNMDDAQEALALSRHLSYPFFLQTTIFPFTYQTCIVRGNATKINSLFLREYLRRRVAIPVAPGNRQAFEGGYTDIFMEGVVKPVVHCDVASLYPSILLAYNLSPQGDHLQLFLPLLRDLRKFRLSAKELSRKAADPKVRDYYSALQQTFKILINSFYGYLGTSLHNFADPAIAAQVTDIGRQTIQQMLQWLEKRGARTIEVDTDGIYFIPPPNMQLADVGHSFIAELSASLPEGIDVEMDGAFKAMFSYKIKNYALLSEDDSIVIKGSGLKSRGTEKYLREFTREMVRLLMLERPDEVDVLFGNYVQRLREHRMPITWLHKTETLSISSATYLEKVKAGRRNPAAAYEIALVTLGAFKAGEQVSFYITGSGKGVTAYGNCKPVSAYDPRSPDENVDFYLEKLRLLKKKFHKYLPRERTLFD